jgi:hypothetical protein
MIVMIGCLLGTLGIIGIVRWAHARRYGYLGGGCGGGGGFWRHRFLHHGHGGFHHGWHGGGGFGGGEFEDGGGYDRDDFGPGSGGDFGGRAFLRRALDPLEMTPAQERAVFAACDELRQAAGKLRGEAGASRRDVAAAFRKPVYDEVLFGELYARHDRALEELRKAFVGTTARVHDALDERQRARLADMIESGPRAFFGGGWGRGFNRRRWSW